MGKTGQVTFSGTVSAQAQAGEAVIVKVTKPDSSIDTLNAATDAQGNYTVTQPYPAGTYSATAHVDADSQYQSADSPAVAFTVALAQRTVTLNVAVA